MHIRPADQTEPVLAKLTYCAQASDQRQCPGMEPLNQAHHSNNGQYQPQAGHSNAFEHCYKANGAQMVAELADSTAEAHQEHAQAQYMGVPPATPLPPPPRHHAWKIFGLGAIFAIILQIVVSWLSVSPVWERFFGRFVWNRGKREAAAEESPAFQANSDSTALVLYSDSAESVEWVNMCWRKVCTHVQSYSNLACIFTQC